MRSLTTSFFARLLARLSAGRERVDGDLLAYARVVFGLIGFYWAAKHFYSGTIDAYFIEPRLHFHYFGFEWVGLFGPNLTRIEVALAAIAGLMISAGFFYRLASLLFALIFTHVFLVDKCLYLNHYYLLSLISWVFVLLPAHRCASVDALFARRLGNNVPFDCSVPRWSIWLLQFHIGLPYIYGAIAKMSPDWMAGEPIRVMLAQRSDLPVVGSLLTQPWCVFVFAAGGLLFDLFIVPALLYSRTRLLGCAFAICFHLINSQLWTIGVFPWFMLLMLLVYFPPGTIRRIFVSQPQESMPTVVQLSHWKKVGSVLLLIYVGGQILIPLRHYVTSGNPNWTEEEHYFSWHMMLRGKRSALRLVASDKDRTRAGAIDLRNYVTVLQLNRVARDPRLIHELVKYVEADLESSGIHDAEIRALALVSMNGRKPQHLVDPTVNLAAETLGWAKPDWIVPLTEPLRRKPWDRPMSEWEQAVAQP